MRTVLLVGVGVASASCASGRADPPRAASLAPVALCATRGAVVDGAVNDAVFRATAPGTSGDAAELAFTVRGATAETVALASGSERRQLGLKLRAADGCNLVYVMWRMAPKPGLVVSTKRNPGAHKHAECGVDGYKDAKAARTAKLPVLADGEAHTLRAAIDGDVLTAWIDGREVWRGAVDARGLRGPAGVRSDNLAWSGELRAAAGGGPTRCAESDGD